MSRLPEGWSLVPLRHILRKLSRPVTDDGGVVTAYRDGMVTLRTERREDGYTLSRSERGYQGVEPGDLVFHALDGFAGAIGVANSRGNCTPVYHVCSAPAGDDLRFVAYALRAMAESGYLVEQAGSVRQRSVDFRTWDTFARLPLPRPPLAVQSVIADRLDEETRLIDAVIERRRAISALVRERRISQCENAILGSDGPPRPVARLGRFVNGWAFKPSDFTPGGLPVVRIRQLTDPTAEPDRFSGELPDTVRLRDGDLVFSWSGSLQVAVWTRGPAYLNQHLFRVTPIPGIDKMWLRFALEASKRLFAAHMHGSAMTHITRSMMKDVRIPTPSEAVQRGIGAELDRGWGSARELEAMLDQQVSLLAERRKALIAAAVVGELDVAGSIAGVAS